MRLFDSHCHLDDKSYEPDREAVLDQAREAGVMGFMVVGINPQTARKAIQLAETHPGVFASVGIHPHDAAHCSEAVLEELIELAEHEKVCAWGEAGLDFNRMYSPRDVQEKCFERQLTIAARLDLPLIFHERDSSGRFLEMLKAADTTSLRGVVHCFSGNSREMTAYLDLGLHIGITGIVTMKQRGRALRELVPQIPDDRLLVETDAPYLTPAPERNRTRRNEPAFVKSVLLKVAELRQTDPAAMAEITWQNTCRLYGLTDL
ncbi:MAG: TatD family hydrolase [Desulfobacteraceae bacterium]|nr:TatD family hydrolase [Desulfobacteraceae bacterium]MBC2751093.1 TatD family hydrolase [Desulfobacteraceae bacterium]